MSDHQLAVVAVVAAALLGLIGSGLASLAVPNHPDRVKAAKIFFFAAGIVSVFAAYFWTISTASRLLVRVALDFIGLAVIAIGLRAGFWFANRSSLAELSLPSSAFVPEPLWPRNQKLVALTIIGIFVITALLNASLVEPDTIARLWAYVVIIPWLPLSYFALGCGLTWLAFRVWYRYRQGGPKKKPDEGASGQELGLTDTLRGCQDEWLHEVAKTDKTSIEKLIRIVGILYNPDFEKAHIDFTLCVFNISLYDIAIDNAIKKGAIRFGEDNEKFFYPANIESEHPIDCPSRGDAFFVIRQAIRAEEIERLRKQDNYLIRFYDLEIMFQGGKHFPQADPLRLDVREHYVETQKRMWRAWDQVGFVFGYNDEQWAVIQSGHTDRLAEIEELKAKLKEAETKPPLAPPDIHAPQAPYFAWVGKQTEVSKYIKIGTADYTSFSNVQRAAFLDLYLKPFTDSVDEVNITADITFIGEKYSDRVSAAMWYGRDAATVPIRHNVTQTLFIALFDRFFTTYENQHKSRPLSSRITPQTVYAHIHVFGEYQDSYQEKQKLNLNWWVKLSRDDKTPAIESLDEDGFKLAVSTLTPPDR